MGRQWLSTMRLRLRAIRDRRRLDRDLEDELAFHLEMRAAGLGPLDARRRFGNPTVIKERMREMWTFDWIEALGKDLRYAFRTLRRSPAFAAVAVLTLALGIGANTAIFSVVNAVLLRALPYPDSDRLVELWGNVKRVKVERRGTSMADYLDWKRQSRSFDGMALFSGATVTLNGVREPERVPSEYVGYGYFEMLGVRPVVGRTFAPEEDKVPQRDRVVILSDGFWKRHFGADPAVVGRAIQLGEQTYTVVGVMPPAFRGVNDWADLWLPLMTAIQPGDLTNRGNRGPAVLALLKRGVSRAQAQAEMDAISKGLEQQYPQSNEGRGVEISPLEREIFGDLRRPLLIVLAAVGFVLLIACANVANLMLARSEARQREIAVRIAVGAGRGRMIRQLITESLVVALTGAAAGLLLAQWGVRTLMAASPITLPGYVEPKMDWTVALFTAAVSCLAGIAMGLAPAVHVRAGSLAEAFKQASTRSVDSRGGARFRNALVMAEVAFAMLLLVGAALLMRSIRQLAAIQPGFDPSRVLALRVGMPRMGKAQVPVTASELRRRVAGIPGVDSAAVGSDAPFVGGNAIFFTAEGQPPVTAQNMPRAYIHTIGPDFFHTLRIRLVAGRTFTPEEMQNRSVVIASEALVRRFWPGQDPIGKRIKRGPQDSDAPWLPIVGVVNDMKYRGLPDNPTADPDLFFPFQEQSQQFVMVVRAAGDPASLAPALRRSVREADPGALVYSVRPMEELVARETANARFTGWLMGIFAASALLLAMIGIYGVMAYSVTRRTQEIGVRVALGAGRGDVLRLVVRRGMALVGAGLALGIAGSLALTRLLDSLLYGVAPRDLVSFGLAAAALAVVALAACVIPASRAARIDPAVALRNE